MKYVIANWKMHLGIRESVALARGTLHVLQGKEQVPEIVICPSFTALAEVRKTLARTRVHLGAQNVGPGKTGAFTGEVGTSQLEDAGCSYVLLGHSERRHIFAEPETVIHDKLQAVCENPALTPVLCIGETKEERKGGNTEERLYTQLESALKGIALQKKKKLLIAYEPVWAIGSGEPAVPAEVVRVCSMIRTSVKEILHVSAEQVLVLYGGSVDHENAYTFLREPAIDGLLVGGASLKIHDIQAIIEAACDVLSAQQSSVWS